MASTPNELISYIESLPESHILVDRNYRIVAANSAYRRQFSPQAPVVGRTCHEVSHHFQVPCDEAGETCPRVRALASGQRERVLHLHHTPKGEEYVNIELVPLRDASGELAYFVEKMEPLSVAKGQPAAQGLLGRAPSFQKMLALVARVAPSNASALLLGESGTGKELVARALHEASSRAAEPLVVVDCASLPETLFESELFGHERGAFTGASALKRGLVESASGGTLFLDEVGDIPLTMQVKLLRLLESGTYRRVGSTELRHTDIRVVAATHRDLESMITQDRFRKDLYYRLSAFPIRIPALRDRAEDIPLLVSGLLARVAPGEPPSLSAAALQRLCRHSFPGNVRELRNVLERAALMCDGETIELDHVELALGSDAMDTSATARSNAHVISAHSRIRGEGPGASPPLRSLREVERDALVAQLQAHNGSRAALAKALGISERSLYRRLRALKAEE